MNTKISRIFLLCTIPLLCTGCAQKEPLSKTIDKGEVKTVDKEGVQQKVYSNSQLDFEITLPQGYIVADRKTTDDVMGMGKEIIQESAPDSFSDRELEAAEKNAAQLFLTSKHKMGALVRSNPNIICMVERIGHISGVSSSSDYLNVLEENLKQTNLGYSIKSAPQQETFGSGTFRVLDASASVPGSGSFQQKYIAASRKGFILMFIATFTSDEEWEELKVSMDTFKEIEAKKDI